MMPSQEYFYVSSSRLKELTRFGREVDEFVPPLVAKAARAREPQRPRSQPRGDWRAASGRA